MNYSENMTEIRTLQSFVRFCNVKKWINELKKLKVLDIRPTNDDQDELSLINIDDYQMIMMSKKVQIASQILILKLEKMCNKDNLINKRELLTCFMMSYYHTIFIPEDNPPGKRMIIDYKLLNTVNLITNVLEKNNLSIKEVKYLCITLSHFSKIFNIWKKFDKDRTLIGLVNSFCFRKDHLEKIKNDELLNENNKLTDEQKTDCINILEDDINELKKSLHILDPKFNIENLEENYKDIQKTMMNDIQELSTNVGNSMKVAFYDYLKTEIENGNLKPIIDNLEEIKDKIKQLTLNTTCTNHIGQKIHIKLDNLIKRNMLCLELLNKDKIKNLVVKLIEIICSLSAPIDDKYNIEWLETTKQILDNSYEISEFLPDIILGINEKIDRIITLCANNFIPQY